MSRRVVTVTEIRRRRSLSALLMPMVLSALVAYFGYNAFVGALGIWSMDKLKAQTADLSGQLADLKQQHAALETAVSRMRPQSLDADLADSAARQQLGLMRPDEVVIASPAPASATSR
jgi:cell division protein FtsB